MTNPKFENLLNLALDATEQERQKSPQLEAGYEAEGKVWELIVKYNRPLLEFQERYPQIGVKILMNGYAILKVPENLISVVEQAEEIVYVEKPKLLYFALNQGIRASCIRPLQQEPLPLSGKGVIVAVLDSGERVIIMPSLFCFFHRTIVRKNRMKKRKYLGETDERKQILQGSYLSSLKP